MEAPHLPQHCKAWGRAWSSPGGTETETGVLTPPPGRKVLTAVWHPPCHPKSCGGVCLLWVAASQRGCGYSRSLPEAAHHLCAGQGLSPQDFCGCEHHRHDLRTERVSIAWAEVEPSPARGEGTAEQREGNAEAAAGEGRPCS